MNPIDTVSVIVPTYNRASYINECIDSLLKQTVPALEILVVDDGSEDDTAQRLVRYGDQIQYIRKENAGKAAAVNLGVELARGDWIWVLDDDDVALPNAIESRLAALALEPDAGFSYGPHFLGFDGPDKAIQKGGLNAPDKVLPGAFLLEIARACFFHFGTSLVRRAHYLELGGFDPMMVRGQDYDFQIRLARVAKPVFCPEPIFLFRQHGGVRGTSVEKHSANDRSKTFRRFSSLLGKKVRESLTLGEYCVPPRTSSLNDVMMREALVNRAQVMGNHGCIEELFLDLMSFADLLPNSTPMTPREKEAVGLATRIGWSYEAASDNWPHFVEKVTELRRKSGGRVVVLALANGVFRFAVGYPGSVSERLVRLRRAALLAFKSIY